MQDLAAASFVVTGAIARAESTRRPELVEELRTVSASVRTSIGALRSLLVEIYPPSLSRAGLVAALAGPVQTTDTPDLDVRLDADAEPVVELGPDQQRLVCRRPPHGARRAGRTRGGEGRPGGGRPGR